LRKLIKNKGKKPAKKRAPSPTIKKGGVQITWYELRTEPWGAATRKRGGGPCKKRGKSEPCSWGESLQRNGGGQEAHDFPAAKDQSVPQVDGEKTCRKGKAAVEERGAFAKFRRERAKGKRVWKWGRASRGGEKRMNCSRWGKLNEQQALEKEGGRFGVEDKESRKEKREIDRYVNNTTKQNKNKG